MAQKARKWEEWLQLRGDVAKCVSYADYFTQRRLFPSLQICNTADEAVQNLTLTLENENGMLIPCEKTFAEIPFESVVNVDTDGLLSPLYFSSIEEIKQEKMHIEPTRLH